ncbi:MAG TPA: hemerythrin domain-containing protein [Candidatus Sulfotelmatobacter sp.]|nr:hemerythrin domain-containing protein [Candidatus Sulfotelmatobacter sp.]
MNKIEKSTHVLREEHQLIENAIVAMAGIIKEIEKGDRLDRRQVWELAQSFATFVGRSHHSKEDFLLSMIRARRGCSDDYAVRTFYEEHHRVEELLATLRKMGNDYLDAAEQSSEPLVGSLRDVVDFYPGHMWKADHILFPLADELLSETDQGVLVEQFAWIESAVGGNADEQLRAITAEFHPKPKAA